MRDAFGNNRAVAKAPAQHTPSTRMSLSAVTKGKVIKSPRVLIYGTNGVGKTSWAANTPDPIFLPVESGTDQLDVARFPKPETWQDALDAIHFLTVEDHPYKTFCVDTVDALEVLCWAEVCRKYKKETIEEFGFSKGQKVYAPKEWFGFLTALEKLHEKKGMGVILVGHARQKTWKNPEGDDFDRFELSVDDKAASLLKDWSDAVLFARFETFAAKSDGKRAKGVSTGARVIHTERTAAYDAKNRYSLPDTLPLDYSAFAEGVERSRVASPEQLRKRIEALLERAPDLSERVQAAITKAGDNAQQLAHIENHLSATINIRERENHESD